MRQTVRPIAMLFLTITLCILAIGEAAYEWQSPMWFIGLGSSVVGEWWIERAVRKGKSNDR